MKKHFKNSMLVMAVLASLVLYGCSDSNKTTVTPEGSGAQTALDQQAAMQDYEAALAGLEASFEANPTDWRLAAQLGDMYLNGRQFDKAVIFFDRAIELNPKDPNLYNSRSLLAQYTGDSAGAVRIIDKAIELDDNFQRAWLTKGFILAYGVGDSDGAIKAWEKAVSINPTNEVGSAAGKYLEEFKVPEGMKEAASGSSTEGKK